MSRWLFGIVFVAGVVGATACSDEQLHAASAGAATAQQPAMGGMQAQDPAPSAPAAHTARFTEKGELQRPRGFRRWVYVGAPLTPNDMNNGKAAFPEFHSVYIDPTSYEHYKRHGVWRDGTMVVKELVSVGGKAASSGAGYFMGEFLGVEVALKDAARFPKEPGNWGYFRFTDEAGGAPHKTATLMPTAACAACHSAAAAQDLVFTQYYPVLRAAKNAGAKDPEDD